MDFEQDDERAEELTNLESIYYDILTRDSAAPYTATIRIPVEPSTPLAVAFAEPLPPNEDVQRQTHALAYLPPLRVDVTLPDGYPSQTPPSLQLSTEPSWIPSHVLQNLEQHAQTIWQEYGQSQMLFDYTSYLLEAAENTFALEGPLVLPESLQEPLLVFNAKTKRDKFDKETFDCGICLEPKKGVACYRMERCQHVFCIACLQDFYNNCIREGDVNGIKCLSPDCNKGRRKKDRLISPKELLQIPIELSMVQRYVEMKRKKKIEADKDTVYCPRKWCQGPAASKKYPRIVDVTQIGDSDSEAEPEEEEAAPASTEPPPAAKAKGAPDSDRLVVCEKCNYAFCKVCLRGWHGDYFRCWPRDASELTQEEQASVNYILAHTSPCPTCAVPCQKTHGCNHMNCFQCKTHFCYLCGSWLDPGNPYQHFNDAKKSCYQKLWELEEGDEGNGDVQFDGVRGAEAAALRAQQEAERIQLEELS